MHRYETLETLGNGSFGEVVRARSRKTNEVVAIKKLKALFPTWEGCLQLRELRSLRVLRHENIVQLKEVVQDKEELYFVFEYLQSSLCKLMRQLKKQPPTASESDGTASPRAGPSPSPSPWFSEAQIRSIMYQLFCGLAHMHKHGFFHRDIKPENLLCHDETLKIADLGQAREIRARPPYTDYVATRWYRSPELLLRSTTYNSPIDLWACGCILAELFLQAPLFPGTSEADQLGRICKVLGPPTKENWPEGVAMCSHMQFKFPKCSASVPWSHVLPPTASKAAVQLVQELVQYDPSRRLTAAQALQHRFFDQPVPRPMLTQTLASATAPVPFKAEYKSSTWTRKELPPATDSFGTLRKGDYGSAAASLAYDAVHGNSNHRASKQTIDKFFALSPRDSESLTADDKAPPSRDRGGPTSHLSTTPSSGGADAKLRTKSSSKGGSCDESEGDDESKGSSGANTYCHHQATARQQSDDHLLQDLLDEFIA